MISQARAPTTVLVAADISQTGLSVGKVGAFPDKSRWGFRHYSFAPGSIVSSCQKPRLAKSARTTRRYTVSSQNARRFRSKSLRTGTGENPKELYCESWMLKVD